MPDWIAPIGPSGAFLMDGLLPIDAAHRAAVPHRGVWLHVLSADGAMLLVRRAKTMYTCPGALSIVGEHHQGAEEDEKCAARAIVEELPGLHPLLRSRRTQLHLLRRKPRWFLFDYPLAPGPNATPRYDRCLITEYVLRLEANATEALELLEAGRARELEHETSQVLFEPLGAFAQRLLTAPGDVCAPELLPMCLLDSLADVCGWLRKRSSRARSSLADALPAGCNERPLLGRGTNAASGSSGAGSGLSRDDGVMRESLDLRRVVRAAWWSTSGAGDARASRWRIRRTSDESVCEMPDWKHACRKCDAACQKAGNWVADCKEVSTACQQLYKPTVGEAGTGINAGRAEKEYEDMRKGKAAGGSPKWSRSVKGKDWIPRQDVAD